MGVGEKVYIWTHFNVGIGSFVFEGVGFAGFRCRWKVWRVTWVGVGVWMVVPEGGVKCQHLWRGGAEGVELTKVAPHATHASTGAHT